MTAPESPRPSDVEAALATRCHCDDVGDLRECLAETHYWTKAERRKVITDAFHKAGIWPVRSLVNAVDRIALALRTDQGGALGEVRAAMDACFEPDFNGVDWRDDAAIQEMAARVYRVLNREGTTETPDPGSREDQSCGTCGASSRNDPYWAESHPAQSSGNPDPSDLPTPPTAPDTGGGERDE